MIVKRINNLAFILLVVLLSPVLLALSLKRKRGVSGDVKILVIPQLSRIGDIVCSTPVFRSIKQKYPNSYLAVLSSKKAVGVIKNNPRIDEIIDVGDYGFWGLAKKLRSERFDWSLDLTGTSTTSALTLAGLVVRRVKLTRASRPITEILSDWLNTYRCFYTHHEFLPGHYLKMLEPLGIKNQPLIKEVFESAHGPDAASRFYDRCGIGREDIVIGLSITAGNKIKEWGDDRFLALIAGILEKYKAKIVVIGSKNDEARIEHLVQNVKKDIFSAVGFSLEDLPSLMKRFNLFIAVDTGPIYIAHALKVPLIDILGPVDPLSQPPEDELSIQVKPPVHIKPSSFVFHKPGKSEEHQRAIASIRPEDVLAAVDKLDMMGKHNDLHLKKLVEAI